MALVLASVAFMCIQTARSFTGWQRHFNTELLYFSNVALLIPIPWAGPCTLWPVITFVITF